MPRLELGDGTSIELPYGDPAVGSLIDRAVSMRAPFDFGGDLGRYTLSNPNENMPGSNLGPSVAPPPNYPAPPDLPSEVIQDPGVTMPNVRGGFVDDLVDPRNTAARRLLEAYGFGGAVDRYRERFLPDGVSSIITGGGRGSPAGIDVDTQSIIQAVKQRIEDIVSPRVDNTRRGRFGF